MKDAYLAELGWGSYFQQQLTPQESDDFLPARVLEQHKGFITFQADGDAELLALTPEMPRVTVGDWLLIDPRSRHPVRVLDRKSGFRRKAAGPVDEEQWLAANVEVAFIVCSLNQDYNLNRIERYLSLVYESGVEPVVVLSKEDLCGDPQEKVAEVRALGRNLSVASVNCLDERSVRKLLAWCEPGATVVLLGSSGSGKSTLTNTLLGEEYQETGEIREGDDKGRHTTTRRTLLPLENGAWILDTPGMRELQLADCGTGVALAFSDIEILANDCRFRDCRHDREPGCAVQEALAAGQISLRRLENYLKLLREQAHNAASIAQRRAGDKALGKRYKRMQLQARRMKGE